MQQEFHKSPIGKIFFGKQIPELVKELRHLANELEIANKLADKQHRISLREKKNLRESKKAEKDLDVKEEIAKIKQETSKKKQVDQDLDAVNG